MSRTCLKNNSHTNIPMALVWSLMIILHISSVFHLRLLTTTNANLKQFTLIWSTCRKTPIYCFEVSSRLIEFNQVCFILYVLLFSIITNYFIFQGEHLEVKCTVYWQLTVKHISIQSDHKWNLKNIPKDFYKICTWFIKLFNEI